MRESKLFFDEDNSTFNFGSEEDRECLVESGDFTFAHFKVNGGDATVAGGLVNRKLYYAVALCSPEDNFSKRHGRELACRYMIESVWSDKRGVFVPNTNVIGEAQPAHLLHDALVHFLGRHKRLPWWAKSPTVSFRTQPRNR